MSSSRSNDLFARSRADLQSQRCATTEQFHGVKSKIFGNGRVTNTSARLNDVTLGVSIPRPRKVWGKLTTAPGEGFGPAHEDGALGRVSRSATIADICAGGLSDISSLCCCPAHGLVILYHGHFFPVGTSEVSAAMKASWGTSTRPIDFIRFLPSFCFSSSLRLRVISPP